MPLPDLATAPVQFDRSDLEQRLAQGAPLIPTLKEALKAGSEELTERYMNSVSAQVIVARHSELVDEILCLAWSQMGLDNQPFALLAVGGYGRGELLPHSDVDVAILTEQSPEHGGCEDIERFLTLLWDLGMDIGHSVRTPEQCFLEARDDITVMTNILEARLLTGSHDLFEQMQQQTGGDRLWSSPDFFRAKLDEQNRRHNKYGYTAYKLEPNVKEGPGGLRDIQMVGWVAKRHFNASTLKELVFHGFLNNDEFTILEAGQNFLWRVRYALHMLSGRREDRLLFEFQRQVSELFGFVSDNNSGIEQFMKMYYRTVMDLSRLNEMLLQHFEEAILLAGQHETLTPLNSRFKLRNDYIEFDNEHIPQTHPFSLLEIFLLIQQHPEIKGVRASTVRLIRANLDLINEEFRNDIRARSLFMEIIRHPSRMSHELSRMQRYGVLGRYLPLFEAVTGQMQFDLFHIYTVDEHTLLVIRNMRRLNTPDNEEGLPYCTSLMQQLPKPELLYLAGLFHDIAKGRGGDHSTLGADDAVEFCLDHGLSQYDANLVSWLVRNHLLMSVTTTRKDISDPEVINEFAGIVGDKMHLDYLFLLTVCDIRATNNSLWNSWKDSLLTDLHRHTLRALRRGRENPIDKQERISETQGEALARLCSKPLPKEDIMNLWHALGDDYFLRHGADEIAWHTQGILITDGADMPLIMVMPESSQGSTAVFIYGPDRDFLFAFTTQALDQLGLTVLDARIMTTTHGYALCTYNVLEAATNSVIDDPTRQQEIVSTLRQELAADKPFDGSVSRKNSLRMRQFTVAPVISFTVEEDKHHTLMEITTIDQPGLLSRIGMAMRFCGARLQNARVATFGERVEDMFYITDSRHQAISDPIKLDCLRDSIMESLDGNT